MGSRINMLGRKYGRLTVVEEKPDRICACMCDCGASVDVARCQLSNGKTKSCGCLRKDVTASSKTTHGMHGTPEYLAFMNAKNRCNRPEDIRYALYGGRGIEMRFTSFEDFIKEIGPRPDGLTLDRIDTNGHYEVGNVSWATEVEQARNRRETLSVPFRGETKTLKAWCEELGLRYGTVWARITTYGWSVDRALGGF